MKRAETEHSVGCGSVWSLWLCNMNPVRSSKAEMCCRDPTTSLSLAVVTLMRQQNEIMKTTYEPSWSDAQMKLSMLKAQFKLSAPGLHHFLLYELH